MIKNMTRKGLAIGAGIALATSGLSVPAYAAGELQAAPDTGSLYAVSHTSLFYLSTSVSPGFSSAELQYLKYNIVTGGGFDVNAGNGNDKAAAIADTVTEPAVDALVTSDVYAATYTAGDVKNVLELEIENSSSADFASDADTRTITVQPFIDKNGNGIVDAGEWQLAPITISWIDRDDISLTTVLTQPVLGDTTVTAKVSSTNINLAQSEGTIEVDFTESAGGGATETDTSGVYSATDDNLTFTTVGGTVTTTVPGSGLVVAGTYTATAQVSGTNVGNVSTRTVSTTTVDDVVVSAAASATNTASDTNAIKMSLAASSLTVTALVEDSSNDPIEDKTVTFTVAENAANSLASGAVVTVGANTLTNTNAGTIQSRTVTAVTDEDGKASITITFTGMVKTNALSINASVDGLAGTAQVATWYESEADSVHSTTVVGTSPELVVAKDADFSLGYVVLDQWGTILTATGHTVTVGDGTNSLSAAFVGGKATVSWPGYTANTTKTMTATVFKNNVSTSKTTTTELTVGAPTAPAAVSIAGSFGTNTTPGTTDLLTNTKVWSNADVREGQVAPVVENGISVTGNVTDANGNATISAVTLSGADLLFAVDGKVFAAGSVTVQTNASGAYAVTVYSNKAGKKTMTVAAGAAVKTQDIFFRAVALSVGTSLVLNVPAAATPGSTVVISGSLTDQFGNPVAAGAGQNFAITWSGKGFVSNMPTSVSADGTFSFFALLGSADSGTVTVTAYYDHNGDADYSDAKDLVVSRSFVIGTSTGTVRGWTKFLDATDELKIYARDLVGQGKVQFMVNGNELAWIRATSAADSKINVASDGMVRSVFVSDMLVGRNVIEIYVDGVRIDRRIFTR
jgi:hypothetical protein